MTKQCTRTYSVSSTVLIGLFCFIAGCATNNEPVRPAGTGVPIPYTPQADSGGIDYTAINALLGRMYPTNQAIAARLYPGKDITGGPALNHEQLVAGIEKENNADALLRLVTRYPRENLSLNIKLRIIALLKNDTNYSKINVEEYSKTFRSPDGTTYLQWTADKFKKANVEIKPGCIAVWNGQTGQNWVNDLSVVGTVVSREDFDSGAIFNRSHLQMPGGMVQLYYLSEALNYEYIDTGYRLLTHEKITRKSTASDKCVTTDVYIFDDSIYCANSDAN